jgi:hypothetical protein
MQHTTLPDARQPGFGLPLLFAFTTRYFVAGLSSGAIKA